MTYDFTRTGPQIQAIHDTVSDPSTNQAFTDSIGEIVTPKYTDIAYKDSGGNSAIENMIAGVPMVASVGDICSTGATVWLRISDSTGTISDFLNQGSIYVEDFGLSESKTIQEQTDAINSAHAYVDIIGGGCKLVYPSGNFKYLGVFRPFQSAGINDFKMIGQGSGNGGTEIEFEYVNGLTTSIEWDVAFFGLTLSGFHFRGQGQTALNPNGSKQRGMTDLNAPSASYGTRVSDIQISDFSADACRIARWFQQRWDGCYAKNIGQDGYVLSGDQSIRWTQSGGSFFDNVGIEGDNTIRRFCLWIKSGKPVIQNTNFGPVNNMIKLGEGPSSPCRARIYNANMEWIKENGVGIYVTANSQIIDSEDLLAWGPYDASATSPNMENALAIVYFESLLGRNVVRGVAPSFVSSNDAFGGFDNMIYVAAAQSATDPYLETERSRDDEFTFRGAPIKFVQGPASATQYAIGIAGDKFLDREIETKGLVNRGPLDVEPIVWTRSTDGSTLNLDPTSGGALPTISHYNLIPDDGQQLVSLPPPSQWLGRPITFTNITSSNNFRLNTFGTTMIDGVDGVTYSNPYASVTIIAVDNDNWVVTSIK